MKCKNCGNEVEETAIFCTNCGEKIDTHNCEETSVVKKTRKKTALLIVFSVISVLLGGGILFVIMCTSAKACIKRYAYAIVSEKWENAYQYCEVIENTELSKENYINWAKNNLSNIKDYDLEEISDNENRKKYRLTFTDENGKTIFRNYYEVKKQDEKMAFLLPIWKIEKDSFVAEQVSFSAPEGVKVYVDEVKLEAQSVEDEMVLYQIPAMFVGPHSVKGTKQFYTDYEETVIINEDVTENAPFVLEMKVSETVVQDVCFTVPNGAEFYLDDEKVDDTYLDEDDSGERATYKIPFLEQGGHKVKVVKKYYDDYEDTIEITSTQAEEPVILTLNLSEGQEWRKAYYEFLTAVQNQDAEGLRKAADDVEALYGAPPYDDYAREKSQVEFKLIYLNDDDIPELLLTRCFFGMVFTYYENEVRAISLEGIDGSYRGSTALLWGSRCFFDFTEKEGLIAECGSGGAASTNSTLWQYTSGFKAKVLYYVYADYGGGDYSHINGNTDKPEKATAKIDECWNKIKGVDVEDTQKITDEMLVQELDYIP